jgi:hypothetical protein
MEKIYGNLRKPARDHCARVIHWFLRGQEHSKTGYHHGYQGSGTVSLYKSKLFFVDLVGFEFWDRIREALASRITYPVLNSPGDHGNIVKTGIRGILNLYEDPTYKNQTSENAMRYRLQLYLHCATSDHQYSASIALLYVELYLVG